MPPYINDDSYQNWLNKRALLESDLQLYAKRAEAWKLTPSVHFVVVIKRGDEAPLADLLDSLSAQFYKQWRLTVIAPFPAPVPIEGEEVKWVQIGEEVCVIDQINQTVQETPVEWILLIPPGVQFEPHYLFSCVSYINIRHEWELIYTDEDCLDERRARCDPKFKPDFNLDLLRATSYMGPCLVRREVVLSVGGYEYPSLAGSYDMAFKVLEQCGEKAMGHIADPLCHVSADLRVPDAEGQAILTRHLERSAVHGTVHSGYLPGTHHVCYQHEQAPLVSVILPTKDKLSFFQPCMESLLKKTAYPHYEVIVVDNQSADPAVIAYYQHLLATYPEKVRLRHYEKEFNYAAVNNDAARWARGEYLLLLNNDVQILQENWLDEMLAMGQRQEVGIVGARLVYPMTGRIQHAGVILGIGVADHSYNDQLEIHEPGYMGRAQMDQNLSAVTGACLLIRKSIYNQVRGMDETHLKVLFNDVDLCLKVSQLGYKIVWTPHATLMHHGSGSIKTMKQDLARWTKHVERGLNEVNTMLIRWLPKLAADTAYNPNLTLDHVDFNIEKNAIVRWDPHFHEVSRILGIQWEPEHSPRVAAPFRGLNAAVIAQCQMIETKGRKKGFRPTEIERLKPEVVCLHGTLRPDQVVEIGNYRFFNKIFCVYSLDQPVVYLPGADLASRYHLPDGKAARSLLRDILSTYDRLIVTTLPLAEMCKGMIKDIHVIPDYLEWDLWGG